MHVCASLITHLLDRQMNIQINIYWKSNTGEIIADTTPTIPPLVELRVS